MLCGAAVASQYEPDHFYRLCSVSEAISFYMLELLPTELIDHYLLGIPLSLACKLLMFLNKCCNCLDGYVNLNALKAKGA